jgi:hypothetical protein
VVAPAALDAAGVDDERSVACGENRRPQRKPVDPVRCVRDDARQRIRHMVAVD